MRLELNLQNLSAEKYIADKIIIKIIVNGTLLFKSDWAFYKKSQNIFAFYQKNIITIPDDQLSYLKFQIYNQKKSIISQKTVLNNQARHNKQIQLYTFINKIKIKLKYTLIETISQDEISGFSDLNLRKKGSIITEQPQFLKSQQGKMQILKMGSHVYHFSQRLDPVMWLHQEIMEIITWKSPGLTIGTGIFLTLVIMNLKLSVTLMAIFLIFGKNILIRKIQKINKMKNVHKRVLIPKENYLFLQDTIKFYNQLYQNVHQFCLNQDKTDVINLIHHICRASFLLVILLFIFSVQHLIVFSLWTLLLLFSPQGIKLFKQIWPSLLYFEKQTQKYGDIVAGYIKQAIGKNQQNQKQVIKQVYYFQYQRWFMGKGWCKPLGILQYKFSNQDWKIQVLPKSSPPQGWAWIDDCYQVDYNYLNNVDEKGYQYTNDLSKQFNATCNFATVRRRRYSRKCKFIFPKSSPLITNFDSKNNMVQTDIERQILTSPKKGYSNINIEIRSPKLKNN